MKDQRNTKEIKLRIIAAGYKAVDELIKVAEENYKINNFKINNSRI